VAILPGPRSSGTQTAATGMAIKIEDGDGYEPGDLGGERRGTRPGRVSRRPGRSGFPRPLSPTRIDGSTRAPRRRSGRALLIWHARRTSRLLRSGRSPVAAWRSMPVSPALGVVGLTFATHHNRPSTRLSPGMCATRKKSTDAGVDVRETKAPTDFAAICRLCSWRESRFRCSLSAAAVLDGVATLGT